MSIKNANREYALDNKVVKLFESFLVWLGKGNRKLFRFILLRILKRFTSKGEATQKPHQAFRCSPLLLSFFVLDEVFECTTSFWNSIVAGLDFLRTTPINHIYRCTRRWWNSYCDVSIQIWLNDWKGRRSKRIYGAFFLWEDKKGVNSAYRRDLPILLMLPEIEQYPPRLWC